MADRAGRGGGTAEFVCGEWVSSGFDRVVGGVGTLDCFSFTALVTHIGKCGASSSWSVLTYGDQAGGAVERLESVGLSGISVGLLGAMLAAGISADWWGEMVGSASRRFVTVLMQRYVEFNTLHYRKLFMRRLDKLPTWCVLISCFWPELTLNLPREHPHELV